MLQQFHKVACELDRAGNYPIGYHAPFANDVFAFLKKRTMFDSDAGNTDASDSWEMQTTCGESPLKCFSTTKPSTLGW